MKVLLFLGYLALCNGAPQNIEPPLGTLSISPTPIGLMSSARNTMQSTTPGGERGNDIESTTPAAGGVAATTETSGAPNAEGGAPSMEETTTVPPEPATTKTTLLPEVATTVRLDTTTETTTTEAGRSERNETTTAASGMPSAFSMIALPQSTAEKPPSTVPPTIKPAELESTTVQMRNTVVAQTEPLPTPQAVAAPPTEASGNDKPTEIPSEEATTAAKETTTSATTRKPEAKGEESQVATTPAADKPTGAPATIPTTVKAGTLLAPGTTPNPGADQGNGTKKPGNSASFVTTNTLLLSSIILLNIFC